MCVWCRQAGLGDKLRGSLKQHAACRRACKGHRHRHRHRHVPTGFPPPPPHTPHTPPTRDRDPHDARQRPARVGHAEQYTRVPRRQVSVIAVQPRQREAGQTQSDGQQRCLCRDGCRAAAAAATGRQGMGWVRERRPLLSHGGPEYRRGRQPTSPSHTHIRPCTSIQHSAARSTHPQRCSRPRCRWPRPGRRPGP